MKRFLRLAGLFLVFVIVVLAGLVAWLAVRSPAMQPASSERIQVTSTRIERGRYLAHHVSDCFGCHSDHVLDRFGVPIKAGTLGQGGFAFDEKFGVPGFVAAQNITPDRTFGVGRWSDGEIMRAIREGVTPDGRALFPMMPYQGYRNMSDEDVKSIVAYLRTIDPIKHRIPERKINFPVNLLIKFAPQPVMKEVVTPDDTRDHLAYGKYLVDIAGCAECHTPRDSRNQPIKGEELSGGWEMVGPWGRVVTANITPDRSTFVGTATKQQFIARFKAYDGVSLDKLPEAHPGTNTIMPWIAFSGMTEKDLGAIYDYLHTLKPVKKSVVTFPDAGREN